MPRWSTPLMPNMGNEDPASTAARRPRWNGSPSRPAGPGPTPIGRPARRPSPPGSDRKRDRWAASGCSGNWSGSGEARPCRQVAQLLTDSDALVRESARRALQKNPGCGANAAIVKAIGSAEGPWHVALINALGERAAPLESRHAAPRGGLRRRRRPHGRGHRPGETGQSLGAAGDRSRPWVVGRPGPGGSPPTVACNWPRPSSPGATAPALSLYKRCSTPGARARCAGDCRHRPAGQRSRSADPLGRPGRPRREGPRRLRRGPLSAARATRSPRPSPTGRRRPRPRPSWPSCRFSSGGVTRARSPFSSRRPKTPTRRSRRRPLPVWGRSAMRRSCRCCSGRRRQRRAAGGGPAKPASPARRACGPGDLDGPGRNDAKTRVEVVRTLAARHVVAATPSLSRRSMTPTGRSAASR